MLDSTEHLIHCFASEAQWGNEPHRIFQSLFRPRDKPVLKRSGLSSQKQKITRMTAEVGPRELVEDGEAWPRAPALPHGELLAEHEVPEDKIAAAAKQADKRAEPQERQAELGRELHQICGGEIAASY
jgi:hypothetical protein